MSVKKIFPLLLLLFCIACGENKPGDTATKSLHDSAMVKDPHSLANPADVLAKHLDLDSNVDFENRQISGKAVWTVENLTKSTSAIFDSEGLTIKKITLNDDTTAALFSLGSHVKFLGQALQITVTPETKKITIYYSTSKDAGALQWLTPQQTSGKKEPFLFTQSEPVLARSWVPCQDGPAVRFTYNATVTVPRTLLAVMSAENLQQKTADGIYHFKQKHAIPSYLMALAVGDLVFKSIDDRTGIYAEPQVLDKAVYEFADMGKMVSEAEKLYGPYRWGRYDLLVLPPSFPYGGMENPNLTFATPTVLAGDRSLVNLVAHELAHSWSGNLVTNATWNDMWLNEGFTVYFERRIVEAIYGKEEAQMQEVLGRQSLDDIVKTLGDTSLDTRLKQNFAGRDPDDGSSEIAYEKGYSFLRTIEEAVGRQKFDAFLRKYFDVHAFQSRTTEQFLQDLKTNLIAGDKTLEEKINIDAWVYKAGIPANIPPVGAAAFVKVDSLLAKWNRDSVSTGLKKQIKSTNEILYFISHLPAGLSNTNMSSLDKTFGFTNSGNAEIQAAWYVWAVRYNYKTADSAIEKFLLSVGRRKFIVPIYKELIKTTAGQERAKMIYAKARPNYHPVAQGTLDDLIK